MSEKKTPSNYQQSEKLFAEAVTLAPGGVHSPVRAFKGVGGCPIFVKEATGSTFTDVDNNTMIDFCMSWGPLILGHQDEDVKKDIIQCLDKGWSYGTAEPYSLELMRFMKESLPWIEKMRFVNSGTEAVMSALRLARAVTGKDKIVKFDGCYHGHTDSMLVKAGSGLTEMASPDSAGITDAMSQDTIVVPLNDLEAIEKVFAANSHQIAAVIVEPIPANNGLLLQNDEFLPFLREITTKHNSLLIFDEVITGFRAAFGGMAEVANIEPDLATYGKVIGGGFPVGAYAGKSQYMDLIAPSGPVYQAGTLSANPVAMQAGLTTLKKLKRLNPYATMNQYVTRLAHTVENGVNNQSSPRWPNLKVRVQHFGSLFWMVFGQGLDVTLPIRSIDQIPAEHKEIFPQLFHRLLDKGFYLAPAAFEVGFLSAAHTAQQVDDLAQAIVQTLKELD